jgi:hypothetical protein
VTLVIVLGLAALHLGAAAPSRAASSLQASAYGLKWGSFGVKWTGFRWDKFPIDLFDSSGWATSMEKRLDQVGFQADTFVDASPETVRSRLATDQVFYFGGHGVFNEGKGSGVLLNESGEGVASLVTGTGFFVGDHPVATWQGLDLSNLKAAIFCSCDAAAEYDNPGNIMKAFMDHGAQSAIGFDFSIQIRLVSAWSDLFGKYAVDEGKEVSEAAAKATRDLASRDPSVYLFWNGNVVVKYKKGKENAVYLKPDAGENTAQVPAIAGLNPASGPTSGGTSVVISGTGFTAATAVTFGGTPATFRMDSGTQITTTAPPHDAGAVQVQVITPRGLSADTVADGYTYVAAAPPPITTSQAEQLMASALGVSPAEIGIGTLSNFDAWSAALFDYETDYLAAVFKWSEGEWSLVDYGGTIIENGDGTASPAFDERDRLTASLASAGAPQQIIDWVYARYTTPTELPTSTTQAQGSGSITEAEIKQLVASAWGQPPTDIVVGAYKTFGTWSAAVVYSRSLQLSDNTVFRSSGGSWRFFWSAYTGGDPSEVPQQVFDWVSVQWPPPVAQ